MDKSHMTSEDTNEECVALKGVVATDFFDVDPAALISLMERKHLTLNSSSCLVTCKLQKKGTELRKKVLLNVSYKNALSLT